MIFVSHANPEDNDFARWLSLQLARQGFWVWSDVTKLIGGEPFWTNIEHAITQDTHKFLLCISKHANKPGVLRELDMAIHAEKQKSANIIVPLKMDDTPFSAFPRNLGASVNAIRFDDGWAAGLGRLLEMLKRDGVQPQNRDGVSIVSKWWQNAFPVMEGIREGEDVCVSNSFPASKPPENIWFHPAGRAVPRGLKGKDLKVIAEPFANGFISFCSPEEMRAAAPRFVIQTSKSMSVGWSDFITGGIPRIGLDKKHAHTLIYSLIRNGFEKHAEERGCQRYTLSNDKVCYWLAKDFLVHDEWSFIASDGKSCKRALVGYKTMSANKDGIKAKRLWHFAVQGLPAFEPELGIILKTHVVFTPDGKKPFGSDRYQHSARRNQGKGWWNNVWRDRLLAMMSFLAGGASELRIRMAEDVDFSFSASPTRFITGISYIVVDKQSREDLADEDADRDELPEDAEQ